MVGRSQDREVTLLQRLILRKSHGKERMRKKLDRVEGEHIYVLGKGNMRKGKQTCRKGNEGGRGQGASWGTEIKGSRRARYQQQGGHYQEIHNSQSLLYNCQTLYHALFRSRWQDYSLKKTHTKTVE